MIVEMRKRLMEVIRLFLALQKNADASKMKRTSREKHLFLSLIGVMRSSRNDQGKALAKVEIRQP